MKKYLSFLCFFLLAVQQLSSQTDAKYLEGAIPVIDGKVTFTADMNVGSLSKAEIHETLLEWASNRFQTTDKFKARILYNNSDEGTIAIAGDEYIVFSSTALALDRTRIYYHFFISIEDGKCNLRMTRIHYLYQEERYGGEKYDAESWITDDNALNKSKTKLYPICGKFRRKTIDLKDELFKEIQSLLGNRMIAMGIQAAPVTPESQVQVNQPQPVAAPQAQAALVAAPARPDNEELISQATRMTITAGNDEQFEISKECWGGFGELFGKKVTFCLIDSQKTMGNMLMLQSESYKISFYTANQSQPALVIHCKKLMSQNISGEEAKKMSPNCMVEKTYNMYVGEFTK